LSSLAVFFNDDDDGNNNADIRKVPEINNTTETASPKSTVRVLPNSNLPRESFALLSSAIKARELWFLKCELKGLNECGCCGWKSEKQAADEFSSMLIIVLMIGTATASPGRPQIHRVTVT